MHTRLAHEVCRHVHAKAVVWLTQSRCNDHETDECNTSHQNSACASASVVERHHLVQFPDPHWKLRNRKKRIVQPQLVEGVAKLLAAGGRVFLQSDVQEVRPNLSSALHGIKHRLACCCKNQSCLSGKAKT